MKLTKEIISEIEYKTAISIVIADFYDTLFREDNMSSYKESILKKYKHSKLFLKQINVGLDDLLIMIEDLPISKYEELNKILKQKFNITLENLNQKQTQKINSIISVQKIQNEEEYYFVKNYTERIATDDNYATQTALLDDILFQFENKK